MRVLLTRPRGDSVQTAAMLAQRDIDSLIEPLFTLIETPRAFDILADIQGLIFTSRHAVRLFAARNPCPALPVFCVGDRTAAEADAAGFADIRSAGGNAGDLARLIAASLPPAARLLRLRGVGDDPLCRALRAAGFEVVTADLYSMQDSPALGAAAQAELKDGTLDGVCLYSPRAGAHFATLVRKAGLAEACRTLRAWCISEPAAAALGDLPFAATLIAAAPTQDSLLALLTPAD